MFNDVIIIYYILRSTILLKTLINVKLENLDSYQLIVLNALWMLYSILFFLQWINLCIRCFSSQCFTYFFLTRRIEISLSLNLIIKVGRRTMNLTTS
jgi:hypothetical protein